MRREGRVGECWTAKVVVVLWSTTTTSPSMICLLRLPLLAANSELQNAYLSSLAIAPGAEIDLALLNLSH